MEGLGITAWSTGCLVNRELGLRRNLSSANHVPQRGVHTPFNFGIDRLSGETKDEAWRVKVLSTVSEIALEAWHTRFT